MAGEVPCGGRFRFTSAQKLRHPWEFERVRREGQRTIHGCLILNWRHAAGQEAARLGVVTSKKIGNAVVRSRARRLLREAFRLHQHELPREADLVLIARQSIAGKNSVEVGRDFITAARRAKLMA